MSAGTAMEKVMRELKEKHGFITMDILEQKLNDIQNSFSNPSGIDHTNINDNLALLEHLANCNNPNCSAHQFKIATEEQAFLRGVNKGISIGEQRAKIGR